MAVLTNQFRANQQPILTSAGTIDIATGRTITPFYAGDIKTGSEYILSTTPFYSDVGSKSVTTTALIDISFDLTIRKTLIMEGDCIISIPMKLQAAAGGLVETVKATLQQVSGGVTTSLGNASSTATSAATATTGNVLTVKFAIARTVFMSGDTLRLKCETTTQAGAGSSFTMVFDPKGRTSINGTSFAVPDSTQLVALLPLCLE